MRAAWWALTGGLAIWAATPAVAADRSHPPVPVGSPGDWFGPAAYPPLALRAGEQGRVVAMVAVNVGGRPTGCTIASSSGSPALDQGTCAIASEHMTFAPAADADGRPVAGAYRLAVRWAIPQPVPETPVPVQFVASGGDVSCLVTIGGVQRRMKAEVCAPLVKEMAAKGIRLDQPQFIDGVRPEELEGASVP